jgi:hypothetical protein
LYINYNYKIDDKGIGICIGSIDFVQGEVLKQLPRIYIFVKEKASWFEVPDREERQVEYKKEFQTKIDIFLKSKDKGEKKGNVTAI